MYEEIMQPGHKLLFNWSHARKLPVIVHSCGFVEPLVPGLAKAGMDCLPAMEVKAGMNVARLAEKFAGRLSFFGGIDVRTLIANDRRQIAAELERKIPAVLRQGCGYTLRSDHSIPPEVDYETLRCFFKRGREIGTPKKTFGTVSGAAEPANPERKEQHEDFQGRRPSAVRARSGDRAGRLGDAARPGEERAGGGAEVQHEVRRLEPAELRVERGAGRGGHRPDRPAGRPRHRFLPGQRAAFRPGAAEDASAAGDRDAAGRDPGTQAHPGRARGQLHPRRTLPDVRLRADEHHPRQGRRREDRFWPARRR